MCLLATGPKCVIDHCADTRSDPKASTELTSDLPYQMSVLVDIGRQRKPRYLRPWQVRPHVGMQYEDGVVPLMINGGGAGQDW